MFYSSEKGFFYAIDIVQNDKEDWKFHPPIDRTKVKKLLLHHYTYNWSIFSKFQNSTGHDTAEVVRTKNCKEENQNNRPLVSIWNRNIHTKLLKQQKCP